MPKRKRDGYLSNYCGPGGSGPTQHTTDAACAEHDREYGELEKKMHPYAVFTPEDQEFINDLRKIRRTKNLSPREASINWLSDAWFTIKKHTAPHQQTKNLKRKRPMLRGGMSKKARDEESHMIEMMHDGTVHRIQNEDTDAPMEEAAARGTTPGTRTNSGREETPITPAPPEFGLPDTHTAIVTLTGWSSVACAADWTSTNFVASMVDPQAILSNTSITSVASGQAVVSGTVNKVPIDGPGSTYAGDFPYPSDNSEIPSWWIYWSLLYSDFTTLGCQWRFIMQNVSHQGRGDCLVNQAYEVYSATDATEKIVTTIPLYERLQHKGQHWKHVEGTYTDVADEGANRNSYEIMSGTYRPGQAKRIVENDADTKTWTKTGTNVTLKEDLHLQFFRAPLSREPPRLNVQWEFKYIVQFKNIRQQIDQPYTGQAALAPSFPGDILQIH